MRSVDQLVESLLAETKEYAKGDKLRLTRKDFTWTGEVTAVTRKLGWPHSLLTMVGSWDGGPNKHVTTIEVFADEPGLRPVGG